MVHDVLLLRIPAKKNTRFTRQVPALADSRDGGDFNGLGIKTFLDGTFSKMNRLIVWL
jgi:hypothetical protein